MRCQVAQTLLPSTRLLDQVEEGEAAVDVALGDRDDEAQVGADELLGGHQIAGLDALGEVDLLGVGQQRRLGDLPQVEAHRVVDEVGVEPLEDVEVPLEVRLRLLDGVGHLGLDFLGDVDLVIGPSPDQFVDLVDVEGLHRIGHRQLLAPGACPVAAAPGHGRPVRQGSRWRQPLRGERAQASAPG